MTIRRFSITLAVAFCIQAGVFAWYHDDLLYLTHPVSEIVKDGPNTFARQADRALARPSLTLKHLDTIAEAAQQLGKPAEEIKALERRLATNPSDTEVKLRLAEALRRAGDSSRAEVLYLEVLGASRDRTP